MGGELLAQRLAAAEGEEGVESRDGAGEAGAVRGEAGEIDVAAEEEGRSEGKGEDLERPAVQSGDEDGVDCGRKGVRCAVVVVVSM